jgi:hypothetical protein
MTVKGGTNTQVQVTAFLRICINRRRQQEKFNPTLTGQKQNPNLVQWGKNAGRQ